MGRGHLRFAALLATLAIEVTACGAGGGPATVSADVDRAPAISADPAVDTGVSALAALGGSIHGRLAEGGPANIVHSPYSVGVALAMALRAADGPTRDELARLLGLAAEKVGPVYNALSQAIASRNRSGVEVRLATGFWADQGYDAKPGFNDDFVADMGRFFGAPIEIADMRDIAEVEADINEWAKDRTRGGIDPLIEPGTLVQSSDPLVAFLLNAIHLDADWDEPFEAAYTRGARFDRLDGTQVTVAMMERDEDAAATGTLAGPGWRAVELPYEGGQLAMMFILPDEGQFAAVEGNLSALLATLPRSLEERPTSVFIPRFSVLTTENLASALMGLGLTTAFDPGTADFGRMLNPGGPPIYLSDVFHGARIEVDEAGTVAGAATAAGFRAVGGSLDAFRADRPFFFALRDRATGAVLFLGRVTDPSIEPQA